MATAEITHVAIHAVFHYAFNYVDSFEDDFWGPCHSNIPEAIKKTMCNHCFTWFLEQSAYWIPFESAFVFAILSVFIQIVCTRG